MKKRSLLILFLLTVLLLLAYWVKCQMGFNLTGLSLHRFLPFRYLQREGVAAHPKPGPLLEDSFDSLRLINPWSSFWARETDKVHLDHDKNGINGSRCLLIRSDSEKSWSYSHHPLYQAQPGDVFSFKGSVKLDGPKMRAFLGVTAYDREKRQITGNYHSQQVERTRTWVQIEDRFTVGEGIAYIGFKLWGGGIGEFRFDDISFRKEGT